jgi:hypothetical protein
MSPLHVVFNLKGVLVGKEYYSITPPEMRGLMLSKRILLKLGLKEFLRRCIKEFIVCLCSSSFPTKV